LSTSTRCASDRAGARSEDQERSLAEQRKRRDDPAGRAERLGALVAVADRDAVRGPVAERLAQARAVPGEVDDHVAHAEPGERCEVIVDQPVTADLEHRLRQLLGQRPHALAAARGQDHRLQRA
jgi:hypothetical protein